MLSRYYTRTVLHTKHGFGGAFWKRSHHYGSAPVNSACIIIYLAKLTLFRVSVVSRRNVGDAPRSQYVVIRPLPCRRHTHTHRHTNKQTQTYTHKHTDRQRRWQFATEQWLLLKSRWWNSTFSPPRLPPLPTLALEIGPLNPACGSKLPQRGLYVRGLPKNRASAHLWLTATKTSRSRLAKPSYSERDQLCRRTRHLTQSRLVKNRKKY